MDGQLLGSVTQANGGRLALEYDQRWRSLMNPTPLSLSMPVAVRTHGAPVVRSFLWGLLPDNERVLDRWARNYQVSTANPFALLCHVGEDCAGAAQLVVPDRVDSFLNGDGGVTWLEEDELADRIRVLREDPTSWHVRNREHFSLAGAQAKTALYFDQDTGRWGEPSGSVPTTHIIKPAVSGLDEHDSTSTSAWPPRGWPA
jgi:serine/threonine-protein kinase HipA